MSCSVPALVGVDWLAAHLGDPAVRVLDATMWLRQSGEDSVSYDSGRENWAAGHIPTAGFADLAEELSAPDARFPYTVPAAERFAVAITRLGVGPDTHVVAYDADSGMWATRLWWLLRLFGLESVSVLDGGLTAWKSAGLPLSTGDRAPVLAAPFTSALRPELRPELLATTAQVREWQVGAGANLVSALPEFLFRGEGPQIAARRGRIPGSVSVPALDLIDAETNRFLPVEKLRARFVAAGVDPSRPTVAYCGGGIAATLDAFVLMMLIGYENVAVYDGSIAEWAAHPELPVEAG